MRAYVCACVRVCTVGGKRQHGLGPGLPSLAGRRCAAVPRRQRIAPPACPASRGLCSMPAVATCSRPCLHAPKWPAWSACLHAPPHRRSTFLGRLKPVSSRLSLLLPAALPVAVEPGAHAVSGPAAARAVLQHGLTSVQASTCRPRWAQSFAFVINSRHQVNGAARAREARPSWRCRLDLRASLWPAARRPSGRASARDARRGQPARHVSSVWQQPMRYCTAFTAPATGTCCLPTSCCLVTARRCCTCCCRTSAAACWQRAWCRRWVPTCRWAAPRWRVRRR